MEKEKILQVIAPNNGKMEETPIKTESGTHIESILKIAEEMLTKYREAFLELAK